MMWQGASCDSSAEWSSSGKITAENAHFRNFVQVYSNLSLINRCIVSVLPWLVNFLFYCIDRFRDIYIIFDTDSHTVFRYINVKILIAIQLSLLVWNTHLSHCTVICIIDDQHINMYGKKIPLISGPLVTVIIFDKMQVISCMNILMIAFALSSFPTSLHIVSLTFIPYTSMLMIDCNDSR